MFVLTSSRQVARWAAEPIALGPGSSFSPQVLGPDLVPVVTDQTRALAEPELAVLSVTAHGKGAVAQAVQIALAAIAGLERVADEDLFVPYSDIIDAALSEAARKALQMLAQGYEFQSEALRNAIQKGRAEGEIKGKIEGKAGDVLAFLEARGIAVSNEQRARVLATTDLDTLERWVRRAATVTVADELFG